MDECDTLDARELREDQSEYREREDERPELARLCSDPDRWREIVALGDALRGRVRG